MEGGTPQNNRSTRNPRDIVGRAAQVAGTYFGGGGRIAGTLASKILRKRTPTTNQSPASTTESTPESQTTETSGQPKQVETNNQQEGKDTKSSEETKGKKGVLSSLFNGGGIQGLWKNLGTIKKIKIAAIAGGAIFFALILVAIIGSASSGFLDYSSDAQKDVDLQKDVSEAYEYNFADICEEEGACTESQKEAQKKLIESQTDFYKRLDKMADKFDLNQKDKNLILTTIFYDRDIDEFIGGPDGAYIIDESHDEESEEESSENIYEEEYDTITELAKQFDGDEENFYTYLKTSEYFDKRKIFNTYFINYAKHEGLSEDFTSWDPEDREAVRSELADNIKQIVYDYQGEEENKNEYIVLKESDSYWWPIGSVKTTEVNGVKYASGDPEMRIITSNFGTRTSSNPNIAGAHHGVDLGGVDLGQTNIIASRSGVVVNVKTGCISGGNKACGGSYGNYVELEHADGIHTLYAHMYEGSISVKVGDYVNQGQVIGKMGNSGNSYGAHLHFEVRLDGRIAVDPLQYIDESNPRKGAGNTEFASFVIYYEGGNNVVECVSGDVPTVGHGLALIHEADLFAKHGMPLSTNNNYYNYCGQTFPDDILLAVFADTLENWKDKVKRQISNYGFQLTEYQIDALTSLSYNCGNIVGFKAAYEQYGATDNLCTYWWTKKSVPAKFKKGITRRRTGECNLFVHGDYHPTN